MDTVAPCRICGRADCDDDCEELALIYREHQREKLRDIDLDDLDDEPSQLWDLTTC